MRPYWLLLALAGCGGSEPPRPAATPTPVPAGLTAKLPDEFVRACERFARFAGGSACPTVVPVGMLYVEGQGPLGRSKLGRQAFHLDLMSPSLRAAGGHWTIAAARGAAIRRVLEPSLDGPCRADGAIRVCRVKPYEEGGGYYGGHVAVAWRDGELMFHITAHGYGNERRVRAMVDSLRRERGRLRSAERAVPTSTR